VKREDVPQQAVLSDPSLQVTTDQLERRRHTRFPASVSAEVIDTKSRARVTGRATDLGAGGCYMDTLNTFPGGTQVEVFLRCEGRTFHCHAIVTYTVSRGGVGMGLAFTETAPDQEASLLDWVKQLGGEPSVEPRLKAEPKITADTQTALAKPTSLKVVVQTLVELLARKRLLTESEARQILGDLYE